MEKTLHDLCGLLLKALPTFFLVALLHYYLKYMFFRPLEKVLRQRYEATEGARQRAEESLAKADAKAAEYDAAIRAARAEIYQSQEQLHQQLQRERDAEVSAARDRVDASVKEARSLLESDVTQAKQNLAGDSEILAEQIVASILNGRAA
jgi:F-type H+-transporting ATPase subunit b